MILGFKPQFKEKIINKSKIHTIRYDEKNRWKAGNIIHFATGIRTKNYNCFRHGFCQSIQQIKIKHKVDFYITIEIDGKNLLKEEIEQLAKNDGFDSVQDFFEWFNEDFEGRIIHWTEFKY